MAYLRQQGKDEVYDVSGATPRHVLYDEAVKNNIWGDVSDVGYDPSKPQPVTTPTTVRYQTQDSPYQQYMNQLYGGGAPTPPGAFDTHEAQNRIRQQQISNYQGLIDEISRSFAGTLSQERAKGEERLGQQRSLSARSGLTDSPMGTAQQEKVTSLNKANISAIEGEKNLRIAEIFSKIDEQTQSRVEAEKNEAFKKSEDYLSYLKESQSQAQENWKAVANSGVDISRLDPQDYNEGLKQTGWNPIIFEGVFNSAKEARERVEYNYINLGNGRVLRTGKTANGMAVPEKTFEYEIPPEFNLTFADDGTPLVFNSATGEAKIAEGFKEGQFIKPTVATGGDGVTPEVEKPSELKVNALTSANALLTKFTSGIGTSVVGKGGPIVSFLSGLIGGTRVEDFKVQFNNLKSLLSLENIKYLKGQGQVSDAERKLLAEASAKLSLGQSESEFKKSLQEIIDTLRGGEMTTTTGGETFKSSSGNEYILPY